MRDFKGMKRQRNRNRRSGGGGQGGQNNNPNRSLDSTGPEGIKVRGNAQTVYERYQQLARDATSSGDRILAENYLQHAEHYFRLLRIMQPNRPVAEIAARDGSNQGFDIDFEDESGTQFAQPVAAHGEGREDAAATSNGEGESSGSDERRTDGEGQPSRRESRRERYERRRQERMSDDTTGDAAEAEPAAASDPLAVIEPDSASAPAEPAEDGHLPSFLTRPTPAPTGVDGEPEAPARKPRTRRPKAAAPSDRDV
ncbi:MAG: DUF4167 domain-containing protein [Caulobacterales bacterium]|nr:DUF4167 domain-containing protein [Caulobacterales bacterium]